MQTLQTCPDTMTAIITGPAKGGRMMDEKRLQRAFTAITLDPEGRPAEVARILTWATPARTYASVWLKVRDDWRAGAAHAGGYGYHRESAAVQYALAAAGVKLSQDIDGRGDSHYPAAIRAALVAAGCPLTGPVYWLQAY